MSTMRENFKAGSDADFLTGGGTMGELIRGFDWSKTQLGPPETWSQAFRTTVRIMLANRFPMLLWWGPDYISIYNDAYIPILGQKHPWGLGRPVRECWSEIWDILKPLIDTPFHGGPATWVEDIELHINRSEALEETHFTVAYSPVPDGPAGGIGGVLATVHEITEKVVGSRRATILRELGAHAAEQNSVEDACRNAAAVLNANPKDVPFALLYLLDNDHATARLIAATDVHLTGANETISLQRDSAGEWPLAQTQRTREILVVRDLTAYFKTIPPGWWPDAPDRAAIVPIRASNLQELAGFAVVGLSSHLKLDQAYTDFLDLMVAQIASAISNARAYETERKRAEELAEIDRAKTVFFSNVSHEFRTPLTLMLGPLEQLLTVPDLNPEVRNEVATAHRNSLRLLKLVNTLLDFSRIEAGRVQAMYRKEDLGQLTREIASNFESAIESAGLEFDAVCGTLPEPVYVDREMWEKIVLNLISNAFKFTFEGRITVRIEREGTNAVLTVTDTGIGIPEAQLPRIFERFHRVEGSRGRTYEGTGIGLALVQELVRLHGGVIAVTSRVGEGSEFRVSIPSGRDHLPQDRLAPAASAPALGKAEAFIEEASTWLPRERPVEPSLNPSGVTARDPNRFRILIADDNADMREHLTRILHGHDILAVVNGSEALDSIRKTKPDLIITDIMMPVLDGLGLIRAVREDAQLRDLPVILLSARAGDEARTEGITAGADDYLEKPFNAKELVARVETTLNLHRVRREAQEEIAKFERRFRAFVTATSDVIYQMSPDWAEMRFLEGQNFIADTNDPSTGWLEKYIHPDDRATVMQVIHDAIQNKSLFEMEHRVFRVDGSLGWTFSRAVPILNEQGEIVEWFGSARDVTSRKMAEEELRRANADLERFAYTASHDLQEPLRGIKIYTDILTTWYRDKLDGESLEFFEHVRAGASRMERLVHDLLEYTRTASLEVSSRIIDPNEVVELVLQNLAQSIAETNANVVYEPLPSIRMHSIHVQQLFQNLIGNAIKYHRPGVAPDVRISAERKGSAWEFRVADNGIGVEPNHREYIFGLFKRLHGDRFQGTGLGLAICQRIVERYGGKIWVGSEPGGGSQFYFTIPE